MIAYHNNWAYYARRFRLNFAGYIEPRPGVPPSASHLAELIRLAQAQQVKVIVRQPYESGKIADFLAEKTRAKLLLLAGSVGTITQAKDFFSLFDYNAEALAAAFR